MIERRSLASIRDFLSEYERERPALQGAASALGGYLDRVLSDSNVSPHMVSIRVKEVDSFRGKLLRKEYRNPAKELTDAIGARVILYRGDEVDYVADILRRNLSVREKDSIDKRRSLGLREFGYRSYHLICQIKPELRSTLDLRPIGARTFEIQVRSILEHVWAEIEHSVAYKSGAELPSELKRRFASLAAVLEMLEREFSSVSQEKNALVDRAREQIESDRRNPLSLDVPAMLALLELRYAEGVRFRGTSEKPEPFPPGIEQRMVLVLQRLNCRTTRSLELLLSKRSVVSATERYASLVGESLASLSHLARLAVAIGVRSRDHLDTFFPEFLADAAMSTALDSDR